jgi:hypothetical protein
MFNAGFTREAIAERLNVPIYDVHSALETSGVGGSPWG